MTKQHMQSSQFLDRFPYIHLPLLSYQTFLQRAT